MEIMERRSKGVGNCRSFGSFFQAGNHTGVSKRNSSNKRMDKQALDDSSNCFKIKISQGRKNQRIVCFGGLSNRNYPELYEDYQNTKNKGKSSIIKGSKEDQTRIINNTIESQTAKINIDCLLDPHRLTSRRNPLISTEMSSKINHFQTQESSKNEPGVMAETKSRMKRISPRCKQDSFYLNNKPDIPHDSLTSDLLNPYDIEYESYLLGSNKVSRGQKYSLSRHLMAAFQTGKKRPREIRLKSQSIEVDMSNQKRSRHLSVALVVKKLDYESDKNSMK